jgi:hypothetical protein
MLAQRIDCSIQSARYLHRQFIAYGTHLMQYVKALHSSNAAMDLQAFEIRYIIFLVIICSFHLRKKRLKAQFV